MSNIAAIHKHTSDLTILVVNHQTPRLARVCIDSLDQCLRDSSIKVVLVDNAPKKDQALLARDFPLTNFCMVRRYPEQEEPAEVGFGRALDLGMRQVRTHYVLILHPDAIVFRENLFDFLLDTLHQQTDVAAVGLMADQQSGGLTRLVNLAGHLLHPRSHPAGAAAAESGILLKSFCCLWDARIILRNKLSFDSGLGLAAGQLMQSRCHDLGYKLVAADPEKVFTSMRHVQLGDALEKKPVRPSRLVES